jgi:methyltransferase family protein
VNPEPFELDRSDPAYPGQAVYTPRMLRVYDLVVTRFSNSLIWRCPARRILEHYDRHVRASHLDVGPGTGYYLDRCSFPSAAPRITLMDPNPEVLRFAGDRISRYQPALHTADALKPIDLDPASFGSVGLAYVLHCMPGDISSKAMVFDNLIPLVEQGGMIFGTTILSRGVRHTRVGRKLMRIYNRKGIFSNFEDDLEGMKQVLASRFERFELDVVGAVALFAGRIA